MTKRCKCGAKINSFKNVKLCQFCREVRDSKKSRDEMVKEDSFIEREAPELIKCDEINWWDELFDELF